MIKFFRTIRQKLLSEGRTGKYLKYAFGEIFLVVIGILIALGINNWNQDRLKQKEIETILIKIQNEIISDLHYSNSRILAFAARDSLKNRILNKQITYDELKTRKTNLLRYSQSHFLFSMQTVGYEQLMDHLDDLPQAYDDLLRRLYLQYKRSPIQRTRAKLDIYEVQKDFKKYLLENESWYGQDLHNNTVSDAQINFYLTNPYFFNYITRLSRAGTVSIFELVKWRFRAIEIYHEINDLLGENSQTIPDIARSTSLNSASEANKYVGTYELTKGPKNTAAGSSMVVTSKDKDLFIQFRDDRDPAQLMNMHESKPWFVINRRSFVFRFEHNGPNTISIIWGNQDQTSWVKVEDD